MNLNHDQLARQLESALGTKAVTDEPGLLGSHAVDGRQPVLFCSPESPEQVAAALRICSEAEAAVTPWGGGTVMALGNLPRKVGVIIGLNRLNRVVEHDDANLTATVEAGISLAQLQQIVARQKQFLPFDAPFPAQATVGGTVAANLNGPRRSFYGSVRDLVIGMKVALVSGQSIKAGGKVVKNVAGYDMCKLFTGSLGTLGIFTEVTLRMAPVHEAAATWVASGALSKIVRLTDEFSGSQLNPTATFILNSQVGAAGSASKGDWQFAVRSEGFEETVARHLRDVQAMGARHGLTSELLHDTAHNCYWDAIRDFPLQPGRLVYRMIVPRASIGEVAKIISEWNTPNGQPAIMIDAAVGTLWIAPAAENRSVDQFLKLIELARARGGHAVMFAGPPELKQDVDVWGSPPPSFSLMREIKRQFDPKGILNPGRFVGGT